MKPVPVLVRRWAPVVAMAVATAGTVTAALLAFGDPADASRVVARAALRDPSGQQVGRVRFLSDDGHTRVEVKLQANAGITPAQFHGLHLHANNDAANGDGCVADPTLPSTTWFASADGHLKLDGQGHGDHVGDLPSLLVNTDGTAQASFTADDLSPDGLAGKVVVLHAGADNFGNVPVGNAPEQYTANSPTAQTRTQNTGNAGDRVACGVIAP